MTLPGNTYFFPEINPHGSPIYNTGSFDPFDVKMLSDLGIIPFRKCSLSSWGIPSGIFINYRVKGTSSQYSFGEGMGAEAKGPFMRLLQFHCMGYNFIRLMQGLFSCVFFCFVLFSPSDDNIPWEWKMEIGNSMLPQTYNAPYSI